VAQGASVVVTAPLPSNALETDDAAVAWRRIVDYLHGKDALVAARIVMPSEATLERAAFAGFDLVIIDPGSDTNDGLAAAIAAARAGAAPRWRTTGWIGAVVHDRPRARAAVMGHAAQLVRAGVNLLWVVSTGDGNARLAAAPLADRLRNELRVATCIEAHRGTLLPDLEAAIAAGRADLVGVDRMP
jgi:2,4-dienoyl-CoA reductase-like NADH-dependent reductase (Old Yellow Enzyme family)